MNVSYNPMESTVINARNSNLRDRYKTYRVAASTFISRKSVRNYILNRDRHKCCMCGSRENLEIDHIISAHQCSKDMLPLTYMNSIDNLQALCSKCNASKQCERGD